MAITKAVATLGVALKTLAATKAMVISKATLIMVDSVVNSNWCYSIDPRVDIWSSFFPFSQRIQMLQRLLHPRVTGQ